MDRIRYLRDSGYESAARSLAARPHNFTDRPTDPERFYEMLVILARGAAADRQWTTAYNIARQVDDSFAPGTDITLKSYGLRDEYTTLTWLAGTSAMQAGRPADAVGDVPALCPRRALAPGRVQGLLLGRPRRRAGRSDGQCHKLFRARRGDARTVLRPARARAARPRPVPAPAALPTALVTNPERTAFQQKRLVRAVRLLGQQGHRSDQTLFVRALVRIDRQRVRPRPRLRTGEPDRAPGPRGVDRALGAQRRHVLLHPRRLSRPMPTCRAGATGRWSMASRARKARSTAPRSATPGRAG